MLEYLIQLPYEALGQSMLGFLEIVDIIQLENATASHEAQQFLKSILPYCPPIAIPDTLKPFKFNKEVLKFSKAVLNWFQNRKCSVQEVHLDIETLSEVNIDNLVLDNVVLYVNQNITLKDTEPLKNPNISRRVTHVKIEREQSSKVMGVLFPLLTSSNSVHSLDIKASNLSQWIEHIKKIGPCLREFSIVIVDTQTIIKTIQYCHNLRKLSISYISDVSDSNILRSIASNCPHLHSLYIYYINYPSCTEADADLTAFAEKCPQLEELSLSCEQITDQSAIALAQHCSRLKKLKYWNRVGVASLIALAERDLPLEELDIPRIPIPSTEIAAQCAHAFSLTRNLVVRWYDDNMDHLLCAIPYMTGLRYIELDNRKDHLLVSHLLLLQRHCADLQSLTIMSSSSITPEQLCELVTENSDLHLLNIDKCKCISDAVLVELARRCPHLQKLTLSSSDVTEKGVLALATHCRQLREMCIYIGRLTEETVRQLAQHCRHLSSIIRKNADGDYKEGWSSGKIRALRELPH